MNYPNLTVTIEFAFSDLETYMGSYKKLLKRNLYFLDIRFHFGFLVIKNPNRTETIEFVFSDLEINDGFHKN